ECLGTMSTDLAADYVRVLVEGHIKIECYDQPGPAIPHGLAVDEYKVYWCLSHPDCDLTINLYNPGSTSPDGLAGVVFHELLHAAGMLHLIDQGTKDPGDQVYAC